MQNKLILFTADFPYGTGETFLETEITYLAEGFDKVLILSQNLNDAQTRQVPVNCTVLRLDLAVTKFQKIKALVGLSDSLFWKEKSIIKKVYSKKISKGIFSTMLISLYRAKKVKNYCEQICNEEGANSKLYFYSYWCDDVALGLAMVQLENSNITCFSRMHGWDVYFEASKINYLPYRHFVADNLKAIFAISQKGIDYARNIWKISKKDVFHLARLGVKEQKVNETINDNFILVSCSNLIPLKRIDLIVRALAEIKDVQVKWFHFGNGSELQKVKALAKELLPETIKVDFKGRVDNQAILEWYEENNPSLFINVSTTEGIPVSIMEAMSFGIPVIATDVGGTSEIVNEENGRLLEANIEPYELASNILWFYELSKENKRRKQFSCSETWKLKYNADDNFSRFVKDIQDL